MSDKDSPINSIAYYDVFRYIEKEDYTILFKKNADVNVGHEGDDEYFWIVLDMVIPYVLEEERELSYVSDETSIFTKLRELISKMFKPKKRGKEVLEKPDWETVVEMMYDKQLDCFDDEVIRVIYSKDKSKRYLILKKKNGILTYLLEYVYQFDDEEWNYISNQENAFANLI